MSAPASDPPRAAGIWAALLAFRAGAPTLPKDRTATVPTKSGQYTYHYTDLGTIADKVDGLLVEHQLVWLTMPVGSQADPRLAYQLVHAPSGEALAGEMPLFGVETSQGHGSAITYGRRYAKVAVLDLIAEDDDDGAAASGAEVAASSSDRSRDTVNLAPRYSGSGITNEAINAARESVGLPRLEKPFASLMNIPAEIADEFQKMLDAARAAQ